MTVRPARDADLDAMRRLPVGLCELEIWGATDTFPDYTASLKAMAEGLPVRFCGAFPSGQGAGVYSRFDVLAEIGAGDVPSTLVMNKIDLLSPAGTLSRNSSRWSDVSRAGVSPAFESLAVIARPRRRSPGRVASRSSRA